MVCSEILLPPHAPPEYADRQTLWNAVEEAEKHPKAQLAYSFDIALQNEFSLEENIALARRFLLEQFVSRGMVVDFAVHQPDKNGGVPNPHFHVLCPIRPIEPDGKWGAKQRREYLLDENGKRVRDEAGNDVFNAVPTTDWGSPETLEHWRAEWAKLCNAKFAEKDLPCRIDHRSYARQGIKQLPTVHEGPAVRQMEAKGIRTDKRNLNKWIKATNALLWKIRTEIARLTDWLKEQGEEFRQPKASAISELLGTYYTKRNAGAYSQKAKVGNLKRYAADIAFLEARGLTTVEDLHGFVSALSGDYLALRNRMNEKSERMKELQTLLRLATDYTRLKPIVDAIPAKGGFGKKWERYQTEHESEIRQFYAVKRKLDNAGLPDKKLPVKAWQSELDRLSREYDAEREKLTPMWDDLKQLNDLRHKVDSTLHDRQRSRQIAHGQER